MESRLSVFKFRAKKRCRTYNIRDIGQLCSRPLPHGFPYPFVFHLHFSGHRRPEILPVSCVMLKFTIDLQVGGDVVGCVSGDSKVQGLSSLLRNAGMDEKLIEKLGMKQQVGGVTFTLHLNGNILVTRSWLLHLPHLLLSYYYSK